MTPEEFAERFEVAPGVRVKYFTAAGRRQNALVVGINRAAQMFGPHLAAGVYNLWTQGELLLQRGRDSVFAAQDDWRAYALKQEALASNQRFAATGRW